MLSIKDYYFNVVKQSNGSGESGGGGLIEVSELPSEAQENTVYKLVKQGGTQVQNSGYVEKVYFNTSKDFESYYDLFSQLTFVEFMGALGCPILLTPNSSLLYIKKHSDNTYGVYYQNIGDGTHTDITIVARSGDQTFWRDEFINRGSYITIDSEVLSSMQGMNVGLQNDMLLDFVSTTPFEAKEEYYIYENGAWKQISGGGGSATVTRELIGGEPISNTGTLSEIYFNTDLSIEEVAKVLSQATYNNDEPNCVLMAQDNSNGISIMQDSGMYVIFNPITQEILFTPVDIGMGFVGWNTNLIVDKKYTFNSEITLLTDNTIGVDNELIKNVVSSSSDFTPKTETVELSGDYDGSSINILAGEELDIKSLIENGKKIPLKVIDKSKTLPQLFAPTISVTSENRIRLTNVHKNGKFDVTYRVCVDGVKATSGGAYLSTDDITPDASTIFEFPLPTEYGSGTHTVSVFAFREHFIDSELSNEVEITIA